VRRPEPRRRLRLRRGSGSLGGWRCRRSVDRRSLHRPLRRCAPTRRRSRGRALRRGSLGRRGRLGGRLPRGGRAPGGRPACGLRRGFGGGLGSGVGCGLRRGSRLGCRGRTAVAAPCRARPREVRQDLALLGARVGLIGHGTMMALDSQRSRAERASDRDAQRIAGASSTTYHPDYVCDGGSEVATFRVTSGPSSRATWPGATPASRRRRESE
jgi:hypothetical protein